MREYSTVPVLRLSQSLQGVLFPHVVSVSSALAGAPRDLGPRSARSVLAVCVVAPLDTVCAHVCESWSIWDGRYFSVEFERAGAVPRDRDGSWLPGGFVPLTNVWGIPPKFCTEMDARFAVKLSGWHGRVGDGVPF